jgi:hypothetical protein
MGVVFCVTQAFTISWSLWKLEHGKNLKPTVRGPVLHANLISKQAQQVEYVQTSDDNLQAVLCSPSIFPFSFLSSQPLYILSSVPIHLHCHCNNWHCVGEDKMRMLPHDATSTFIYLTFCCKTKIGSSKMWYTLVRSTSITLPCTTWAQHKVHTTRAIHVAK